MKSTVELEGTIPYEGCAHATRFILKGESKGKIQRPFRSSQRALSILPNQPVRNFEKSSNGTKFSTWKFSRNTERVSRNIADILRDNVQTC